MPTDEFDDDDRPRRRRSSRDDDFDDDSPPRRRRDDDDFRDDYDDAPRRRKSEGLAIASMILGIFAIPLGCCCGWLSLPVSVTGIILGFVDRSNNGPNGKSTAGIICGFVAILLAVLSIVLALLDVFQFNPKQFGK